MGFAARSLLQASSYASDRHCRGRSRLATNGFKEPDIVAIELTNVGDSMPPHAETLDAEAKGKTRVDFGIVADGLQHIRINHAGPAEFDPAVVPAHVGLDARLGERKERRPEADVHIFAQVARGEQ